MYLSILGKPTNEELVKYPSVHLTSIHEWDASVLDYNHPECDGEPFWANDPQTLIFLTVILIPMGCSKNLPEFNSDYLVGRTFLVPPGDNGERLRAKVTRKVVEVIEKADGERVQSLSYILGFGNGKLEEIISNNQLVDHLEAAANEDNEISDDLYKFRALIGHQGPLKATDPNRDRVQIQCSC